MNKEGIKFGFLNQDNLIDYIGLYKKFYEEELKEKPDERYIENYIIGMTNLMRSPECLFICVYDKDEMIGILGITPLRCIDGHKNVMIEPMYVLPEYREHIFIIKELINSGIYWLKQQKIEIVYAFEGTQTDKWERKNKLLHFEFYRKLLKMELSKC